MYRNGRLGEHNVVLLLLPKMGKSSAAGSTASLRSSYCNISLALLVGICGGVPYVGKREILLGDVIIGERIFQYDFGRQYHNQHVPKAADEGNMGNLNKDLSSLIAYFKTEPGRQEVQKNTAGYLATLQKISIETKCETNYRYPGISQDRLFPANYQHKHQEPVECSSCIGENETYCRKADKTACVDLLCDDDMLVRRQRLKRKRNIGSEEEQQRPEVFVGNIASGDTVMRSMTFDEQDKKCLADLRVTNPIDDKARITQTKGNLLKGSYIWILEHEYFKAWGRNETQLLWITGDPGKGKTMLLCGLIEELGPTTRLNDKSSDRLLAYFLFQGTDSRINNATAALRSLIYMLVNQHPALILAIREKYDASGKQLFQDPNAWFALSTIITSILEDFKQCKVCIIIDALDECVTDLFKLLDLVIQTSKFSHVQWILSSRNITDIERGLQSHISHTRLGLEQEENAELVSKAVETYIKHSITELKSVFEDEVEVSKLHDKMLEKSNGTFLWVSLITKELKGANSWELNQILEEFPEDLWKVYSRMIDQVKQQRAETQRLCSFILSTIAVVYRPLHLEEISVLSQLPMDISGRPGVVKKLVDQCGSFLTIRGSYVYIIHQKSSHDIFSIPQNPDPLVSIRYSCVYWIDHFSLVEPSKSDDNSREDKGILDFFKVHFLHWLEALSLIGKIQEGIRVILLLESITEETPLQTYYSALSFAPQQSLVRQQFKSDIFHPIDIRPVKQEWGALLQTLNDHESEFDCLAVSLDNKIISFSSDSITLWDLLTGSILRQSQNDCNPTWEVAISPNGNRALVISTYDDAEICTMLSIARKVRKRFDLEANSLAFSSDGRRIAYIASGVLKLWDIAAKRNLASVQSLKIDEGPFDFNCEPKILISFSPDDKLIALAFKDTIRLLDGATGKFTGISQQYRSLITSILFSPDSTLIACALEDTTVNLWSIDNKAPVQKFEGHKTIVRLIAFSPDSKTIATASGLTEPPLISAAISIQLWETATGDSLRTLVGYNCRAHAMAFSSSGKMLLLTSGNGIIQRWDAATGEVVPEIKRQNTTLSRSIPSGVYFSPNAKIVASSSYASTMNVGFIQLWDRETLLNTHTLEAYGRPAVPTVFSPNGKTITAVFNLHGWRDYQQGPAILYSWEVETGVLLRSSVISSSPVFNITLSPDGGVIAFGSSEEIGLFNVETCSVQKISKTEEYECSRIFYSPCGKMIAFLFLNRDTHYEYMNVWDTTTKSFLGKCGTEEPSNPIINLKLGESERFYGLAPDWKTVIIIARSGTMESRNARTGAIKYKLISYDLLTRSAFSPDGRFFVTGSYPRIIRIWEAKALKTTNGDLVDSHGNAPFERSQTLEYNNRQVLVRLRNYRILLSSQGKSAYALTGRHETWLFIEGQDKVIDIRFVWQSYTRVSIED
ncbi:hypothetical protein TWF788_006126 [Orbilia oligospora]|uniref:NACHT domain-containing protein n=1 Tax=Orbilia oligospora TaxID=2813651 RepID=A0A7C8U1R6_ORBOL|nr:hypothetical protein TWF788_006126 [Orbilia oligospora]